MGVRNGFSRKHPFDILSDGYQPINEIERVYFMSKQTKDDSGLAHTRWNCKYHIVFCPKYRRKVIYGQLRADVGKILRRFVN